MSNYLYSGFNPNYAIEVIIFQQPFACGRVLLSNYLYSGFNLNYAIEVIIFQQPLDCGRVLSVDPHLEDSYVYVLILVLSDFSGVLSLYLINSLVGPPYL